MNFEVLGEAVVPLVQILGILDVEAKLASYSPQPSSNHGLSTEASSIASHAKKVAALRALEAAWTKQFGGRSYIGAASTNKNSELSDRSEPAKVDAATRAVLGVLAHVLNSAVQNGHGAIVEAAACTLTTVLERFNSAGRLVAVLSPDAVLRLCTTFALALPPPTPSPSPSSSSPINEDGRQGERLRSEEELDAVFACIAAILGVRHSTRKEGVDDDDDDGGGSKSSSKSGSASSYSGIGKTIDKNAERTEVRTKVVVRWFSIPGEIHSAGGREEGGGGGSSGAAGGGGEEYQQQHQAKIASAASATAAAASDEWRRAVVSRLGSSEEGKGAVAQIVQACLAAARRASSSTPNAFSSLPRPPAPASSSPSASTVSGSGHGGRIGEISIDGWPTSSRLPRTVCLGALTVLEDLLDLMPQPQHVEGLWRPFLPGIASQVTKIGFRWLN